MLHLSHIYRLWALCVTINYLYPNWKLCPWSRSIRHFLSGFHSFLFVCLSWCHTLFPVLSWLTLRSAEPLPARPRYFVADCFFSRVLFSSKLIRQLFAPAGRKSFGSSRPLLGEQWKVKSFTPGYRAAGLLLDRRTSAARERERGRENWAPGSRSRHLPPCSPLLQSKQVIIFNYIGRLYSN